MNKESKDYNNHNFEDESDFSSKLVFKGLMIFIALFAIVLIQKFL